LAGALVNENCHRIVNRTSGFGLGPGGATDRWGDTRERGDVAEVRSELGLTDAARRPGLPPKAPVVDVVIVTAEQWAEIAGWQPRPQPVGRARQSGTKATTG